jgi:hypothetical protein
LKADRRGTAAAIRQPNLERHMLKASWKLSVVVCLIVGLAGASSAQACDAGLRKIVKRHEARVLPLAKKFSQADKALATAPDTSAASAADQALRAGLGRFKLALVPIKTQTPNAKLAKKVLLKAIRDSTSGSSSTRCCWTRSTGARARPRCSSPSSRSTSASPRRPRTSRRA